MTVRDPDGRMLEPAGASQALTRRGASDVDATDAAGQHRGARRAVAGAARPGRCAAARARGRDRPAAGGSRRRLARPPGHGPAVHRGVPRLDRGARALHRGSRRRAGRPRRRPVRHPRRRPRHVRAAPARARGAAAGVRGRPARAAGVEAAAPDRARLRHPDWLRLVPVDFEAGESWWDGSRPPGFDAGRPAVVASTGVSMYLTREANAATLRAGRGARRRLDARDVVPAAARARRRRGAPRPRGARATARGRAARRSSASSRRTRCWRWPATPGFRDVRARLGRRRSPSATSPAAPTACASPPAKTCSWPRRNRRAPVSPARPATPATPDVTRTACRSGAPGRRRRSP